MDALQSSTNQSLQAELRERTEQFNQYWIGSQRQVGLQLLFLLCYSNLHIICLFITIFFKLVIMFCYDNILIWPHSLSVIV